jgi:hypothetical protein
MSTHVLTTQHLQAYPRFIAQKHCHKIVFHYLTTTNTYYTYYILLFSTNDIFGKRHKKTKQKDQHFPPKHSWPRLKPGGFWDYLALTRLESAISLPASIETAIKAQVSNCLAFNYASQDAT